MTGRDMAGEQATGIFEASSTRSPNRWLLTYIGKLACFMAAGGAIVRSSRQITGETLLTVSVALYGFAILIIVDNRIPIKRAVKAFGAGVLVGLPIACAVDVFAFTETTRYVGLFIGSGITMLIVGWISLLTAAYSLSPAVQRWRFSKAVRPDQGELGSAFPTQAGEPCSE
jgi:hypothetical protein